jgi:Na+/H+ antiporter
LDRVGSHWHRVIFDQYCVESASGSDPVSERLAGHVYDHLDRQFLAGECGGRLRELFHIGDAESQALGHGDQARLDKKLRGSFALGIGRVRNAVSEFEALLGLLLAAIVLAGMARRAGVPYPAFLALGGAVLAFVPGAPAFAIEPRLALALFVAPVLLDAAFDASPRDLAENWVPLVSLVVVGVALTTVAVAGVVRALVPAIPWAAAIALGAIVSPPDATAATAVLRHLKPPHRILTILEGESLLNDATALLIYRLALGALATSTFSVRTVAPTFLVAVVGSVAAGPAAAWLLLRLTKNVRDVPTSIIVQFITTFGVWIFADRIGLSGVLTMVCFALAVARPASEITPARMRIPSYAVWDTVVFVLNVLAFVFIGLQIRPILTGLDPTVRLRYLWTAGAVLFTVIIVRVAWVMIYYAAIRLRSGRVGLHQQRSRPQPSIGGVLMVGWSGMRGIVTLAAALALPIQTGGTAFPFRDLIVLTAFAVVLGTLVIQGLTLGPLLRTFELHDDHLVEREVDAARDRAQKAALATLDGIDSEVGRAVRQEFASHLRPARGELDDVGLDHERLHQSALAAVRRVVFDMRANGEIGDDAFHQLEEEFDWMEMANGPRE